MRFTLHGVVFALFFSPAFAAADVQWRIINRPYLQGLSSEQNDDPVFWAYCRPGAVIDLGAGGNIGIGRGEGEAVTLKLTSDGRSATLNGISRPTAGFESTGRPELRTSVSEGDPLFDVLRTGKPVTVSGSMERADTWTVDGLRSRTSNFLRQCR